jgi:NAD(P)-dependent dehydrogenase (short-subunit alcohol dehydrogenase family)
MIGGNAHVTSKAALEAHTLNLAAELKGSGVTINTYRPGGVDTTMRRWIWSHAPKDAGAALLEQFIEPYEKGTLITAKESATSLLRRIPSNATASSGASEMPDRCTLCKERRPIGSHIQGGPR